eukprot:GHRQ01014529.1.p2 GENE.GHRQ01014529.1~~GHRQ01014529.1.p2  ORF type:complete len:109 (-),score=13.83 GHRQ01014529.1:275-601(-)
MPLPLPSGTSASGMVDVARPSSVTSKTLPTAKELFSKMLMIAVSLSVSGPTGAMLGVTSSSVRAPEGWGQAPTAASAAAPRSSVLRSQPSAAGVNASSFTSRVCDCLL